MAQAQDWFAANAPKPAATPASQDWFAANAPAVPTSDLQGTNEKDANGDAVVRDATLTDRALGVAKDLGIGALKGAGNTVVSLVQLEHLIPGVSAAVDKLYGTPGLSKNTFLTFKHDLESTNTTQTVGKVAEQIGETLIPAGKIAKLGEIAAAKYASRLAPVVGETAARLLPKVAVEGAGGAALSAGQGGDPRIGAVAGAMSPVIGAAMQGVAAPLAKQAENKVMQALGPTKERYKAIAQRLTPQILKRGLGGSREALQEKAAGMLSTVGDELDTALQQFGSTSLGTQPVSAALETAKDAFRTTNAAGKVVEFEPRAIKQLSGLQSIISDLGPDATVNQLIAVRRAWDKVVDQAGGFAHRAGGAIGVPLKDQSEAWAKREGTDAIRALLDTGVPDVAAINKEWSFWKGLDDVLTQTLQRTQPQGPGVGRMIAEGAGQVAGAALGATGGVTTGVGGAFALGKVGALAQKVLTSPRWQFVDARLRNSLAEAIVGNSTGGVTSALMRISAVEGSALEAGGE